MYHPVVMADSCRFHDGLRVSVEGELVTLSYGDWDHPTIFVDTPDGRFGYVDLDRDSNGMRSSLDKVFGDDSDKKKALIAFVRSLFHHLDTEIPGFCSIRRSPFPCNIKAGQDYYSDGMDITINGAFAFRLYEVTCINGRFIEVHDCKRTEWGYVDVYPGSDGSRSDLRNVCGANTDVKRGLITWIRLLFGIGTALRDEQIL